MSEVVTLKDEEVVRPRFVRFVADDNPLMLSWHEVVYNPPKRRDYLNNKNMQIKRCFAEGWTGIRFQSISPYERAVISNLGVDKGEIYQTWTLAGSKRVGVADVSCNTNCYEVWLKNDVVALRLHHLLEGAPSRSKVGVAAIPLDPIIPSMLSTLNYLVVRGVQTHIDGSRHDRFVISVQDFDQLGTLMVTLKLTL